MIDTIFDLNKVRKPNYNAQDLKNIESSSFNSAVQALDTGNYKQFETTEFWNDTPKQGNIEKEIIKKDLFEKLSNEAKEVLNIVYNSPAELLEFAITPARHMWSSKGVKKYFKKTIGTKKAKQALPEVKHFLKEIIQLE